MADAKWSSQRIPMESNLVISLSHGDIMPVMMYVRYNMFRLSKIIRENEENDVSCSNVSERGELDFYVDFHMGIACILHTQEIMASCYKFADSDQQYTNSQGQYNASQLQSSLLDTYGPDIVIAKCSNSRCDQKIRWKAAQLVLFFLQNNHTKYENFPYPFTSPLYNGPLRYEEV